MRKRWRCGTASLPRWKRPSAPACAPDPMRDFLSLDDLSPPELADVLDLAATIKKDVSAFGDRLAGKQIALLFEKPSLRTRISFEVGVTTMGGHALVVRND